MTVNNRNTPKPCTDLPERFYHATRYVFDVGQTVMPGRIAETSRGEWVWMASAPIDAWGPYVYEIVPFGDEVQEARGWYRCKAARVVRAANTAALSIAVNRESKRAKLEAERRARAETETGEPWCNHDAVAVHNGVCECGVAVTT